MKVSPVALWEAVTNVRLGKLTVTGTLLDDADRWVTAEGFQVLDLTLRAARLAGSFQAPH